MIVRPAVAQDMPLIVEMGMRFYATTDYAGFAPCNPASMESLAGILMDQGVLLVASQNGVVVGMVGLMVAPFMFNFDFRTAHEVMWWVDEESRGTGAGVMLLRAVEPACRERDCIAIQMIHLANSPPQAKLLYEQMGYVFNESSYTKVL